MSNIKKFINEENGQGMTEYGLILGVIAIGAIAAFTSFGGALIERVNEIRVSVFGQ